MKSTYKEKRGRKKLPNPLISGADGRTRTADLLITNQLLYQLSYIGLYNASFPVEKGATSLRFTGGSGILAF